MSTTQIGIPSSQRWQHARGLRLELAFLRPSVGNMLEGCASHWHSFAQRWQHARGLRLALAFIRPTLATRSGAAPRIGIPSPQRWQHARGLRLEFAFLHPSVGNTLRGCASNWHSFAPALVTRSGAPPYNPMLATLGGYAYMLTSTVFNDINCTPSAMSTLVCGIWHLPARRK
jgi:hypothetical protein